MKLIVDELTDELYQEIRPDSHSMVEAVRLHLYKAKQPVGSLFVEIRSSKGEFIARSESVEITEISSANYFHGQIRFYINAYLVKNTDYLLVLRSDDYDFDSEEFVGWCRDFDFHTYPKTYVGSPTESPFDYEIWQRK